MTHSEKEFYSLLLKEFDKDMKSKGLNPNKLLTNDYIISRTQYYNLKKIVAGDTNIPKFSNPRLFKISEYLDIGLEDILYKTKRKKDSLNGQN